MNPIKTKDLFKKMREEWLEDARNAARLLLKNRDHVTIEDVLTLCPRPQYIHKNTIGKVFNSDFLPVGFVKSRRAVSKGRWIRQWKIKEESHE